MSSQDHAAQNKEIDRSKKYYKTVQFDVTEVKELKTDKGKYGIIKGYASTYGNLDRGGDIILFGAFTKSLERYRSACRPVKLQFQHSGMEILGGCPCELIQDGNKGLYIEGQINLDVQRGREVYALAKQGVLTDMSIQYSIYDYEYDENGNRLLKEIELWEISVVGEPMNPEANITLVKSRANGSILPIAGVEVEFNEKLALERIKEFTRSDDIPSKAYADAFMYKDDGNSFESFSLPFVDVIDGKLMAIPKAIFSIAVIMRSSKSLKSIEPEDRRNIIAVINKYYSKMGLESPLRECYDNTIVIKDINFISNSKYIDFILKNINIEVDFDESRKINEEKLRNVGFSKKAANALISVYRDELGKPVQTEDKNSEVFKRLKQVQHLVEKLQTCLKK